MRMNALISCRRCTELTIWYPALFFSISQSTRESISRPIFRTNVGWIVAQVLEVLILLEHGRFVDVIVGGDAVVMCVFGDLTDIVQYCCGKC